MFHEQTTLDVLFPLVPLVKLFALHTTCFCSICNVGKKVTQKEDVDNQRLCDSNHIKDWIVVVSSLLVWHQWMKQTTIPKKMVRCSHVAVQCLMWFVVAAEVAPHPSGMGNNTISTHLILHLCKDILDHGGLHCNPAIRADPNSAAKFYGHPTELGSIWSLAFNVAHDEVPVLPPAKHLLRPTTRTPASIVNVKVRQIPQKIQADFGGIDLGIGPETSSGEEIITNNASVTIAIFIPIAVAAVVPIVIVVVIAIIVAVAVVPTTKGQQRHPLVPLGSSQNSPPCVSLIMEYTWGSNSSQHPPSPLQAH
ncbi:hypothetical protein MHU86_145 [Fragilaria crotonensis]|nr:hypothetical protein MHU86_145 [Fragilaria crotonensis]